MDRYKEEEEERKWFYFVSALHCSTSTDGKLSYDNKKDWKKD